MPNTNLYQISSTCEWIISWIRVCNQSCDRTASQQSSHMLGLPEEGKELGKWLYLENESLTFTIEVE